MPGYPCCCGGECDRCNTGTYSDTLRLTITNLHGVDEECGANCADLNNTYDCEWVGSETVSTGHRYEALLPDGALICVWRYPFDGDGPCEVTDIECFVSDDDVFDCRLWAAFVDDGVWTQDADGKTYGTATVNCAFDGAVLDDATFSGVCNHAATGYSASITAL